MLIPVLLTVIPTCLVIIQPNLGTSLMLLMGGGAVMFAAGVSLWYFAAVLCFWERGAVASVFYTRGTPWQFLHDYQYRRIDTFLDPTTDPLGARATTSSRRRSRWDRAAGRARASCRAPRAG